MTPTSLSFQNYLEVLKEMFYGNAKYVSSQKLPLAHLKMSMSNPLTLRFYSRKQDSVSAFSLIEDGTNHIFLIFFVKLDKIAFQFPL